MSVAILVIAFALVAWTMGIMAKAALLLILALVVGMVLLMGLSHWRIGRE